MRESHLILMKDSTFLRRILCKTRKRHFSSTFDIGLTNFLEIGLPIILDQIIFPSI